MNARIGNLCGKPALGLKAPKLARGTVEGRRHMARVAQLACVCCGARPVEVHHVISGRFGQRRASDLETIPLCQFHHRIGPEAIHASKRDWEAKWGPDFGYLPVVAALLDQSDEINF